MSSELLDSKQASSTKQSAVELKGSVFTLPIVVLKSADLEQIAAELSQLLATSMKFFENAAVVIDLQYLTDNELAVDFSGLLNLLAERTVIPVGVRNGSAQLNALATGAGLAILKGGSLQNILGSGEESKTEKTAKPTEKAQAPAENAAPAPAYRKTKLITQPVRSGSQVYAAGADLIVMAPVSPGAEIIADGNIHIYSTLRGRALAGVRGDTQARIFCHSLEAELLAIAGNFRVFEDGPAKEFKDKPVQIYLEDEHLIIAPLK
ncbi:MAG: septum site-determining protein MinC [Gammaproteobacteria bacterium]|nr:septum site-determining protein MinC [Gammaproteobacteria bacterium]